MTKAAGVRIHVAEGETRIEADAGICLTTVLGSCVAACIFDRSTETGGMNHFLLAGDAGRHAGAAERYGAYLMEVLVNGLLQRGARRERLQAKLFGGARTAGRTGEIGAANVDFAKRFLANEKIPLVGGSLGGDAARRVEFWPGSGRARQFVMRDPIEIAPVHKPLPADVGEVEFF